MVLSLHRRGPSPVPPAERALRHGKGCGGEVGAARRMAGPQARLTVVFSGAESIEAVVRLDEPVEQCKGKILELLNDAKPQELRLFFRGKELDEVELLGAYGIGHGDTLDAVAERPRRDIAGTLEETRGPQYSLAMVVFLWLCGVTLAAAWLFSMVYAEGFSAEMLMGLRLSAGVFITSVVMIYTPTYLHILSTTFFGRAGIRGLLASSKLEQGAGAGR